MSDEKKSAPSDRIALAADIVSAYVRNNPIPVSELPGLIARVNTALVGLENGSAAPEQPAFDKPTAAQIRKSVSDNGIISFIDGKIYQSLKRHLRRHGLDGPAYRERYGLPADYPITSPVYSARRAELAKSFGLGQQRRKYTTPVPKPVAAKPKGRGRKKAETPIAAE